MHLSGFRVGLLGTVTAVAVTGSVALASLSGSSAHGVPRGYEVPAKPSVAATPPSPISTPVARVSSVARVAAARRLPPTYIATLDASTAYYAVPGGASIGELPATNPFGSAEVLAVIGSLDTPGWLHVELPIRPNGSTGWISSAGVALTETYYKVKVDLAAHTLTVTEQGRAILTVAAAVGAPATPTPPDSTYLWELIRPDDPNGAYGPYIFGLGEFSDAYSVFNGGDAQIGIHGQDDPGSVGLPVSHGCVRLANNVIATLAGILPLGTPVTIS